jgi:hypothetical protein
VVVAVPCIGIYCAGWAVGIWAMIATGFILASATREPAWRVVCGMLAPMVLAGAILAAIVALTMSTAATWSTGAPVPVAPGAAAKGPAADPGTAPDGGPETATEEPK